MEHLFAEHLNEPGIRQAMQQMFYQLGIIDEQGNPVAARVAGESAGAEVVGAGTPAAESGQL